ncbi:MAG TPA: lysophospholipid acyltransferase family protein [Acidobacteriaceae bacterium]|nr:lysophospholipid acyltransferase family protein [Acidobacteriaceae bacterium]
MLAAIALPASCIAICLRGLGRRRAFASTAARFTFRLCGIRLTTIGIERLPAGPCIVAANHASYLDGIILTAALPPRFTFVIKKEMRAVPLIGLLLQRLGSEFVSRDNPKAASGAAGRLVRAARAGNAIGVFPEGTFRREPGLREFRLGGFLAAARGGLPVAPVTINGSRRVLPAGEWRLARGPIDVVIGTPVAPPSANRNGARLLCESVRDSILKHYSEHDAARSFKIAE